jgi:hypothetical protein
MLFDEREKNEKCLYCIWAEVLLAIRILHHQALYNKIHKVSRKRSILGVR